MAVSTAKLRDKIKGMTGVDIMIDDKTFKSTYQIIQEISKVWDKLSDIDRTAVLELMAGKNRSNQVGALISNFAQAEKALETSINSTGSAAKENAAYIDSIQGRIAQLKATFEDLSSDVIDSELFKFIITTLNKLLKLLDLIVEKVGALPTVFLVAATALNKKFSLFNDKDILSKFTNLLKNLKKKAKASKIQVEIEPQVTNTGNIQSSTPVAGSNPTQTGKGVPPASGATSGLALFGKALVAAVAIAVAMKLIQAAMETWFMKLQKAEEKVSELSEQYNNVKDELDSINSKLEENQQKIDEINANGLDFTNDELEELQKQNEELELQKQYLEDIAEIKKNQLNNATQDLLDINSYTSTENQQDQWSAAWEQLRNGQYEKALGTVGAFNYSENDNGAIRALKNIGNVLDLATLKVFSNVFDTESRTGKVGANITAQESAREQIDKLNGFIEQKQNILKNPDGVDYNEYIKINSQIKEMNESLTETMNYLTEQQKTLNENSKLYQEINDLVEEYSNTNKNIKLSENGFIDLSLETYFDDENFDEEVFKKVQKILEKNKLNGYQSKAVTKHFKKDLSQEAKDVLSNNNIKVTNSIDPFAPEYIDTSSYQDIINTLQDINQLKEQGLWTDSKANQILEETLYTMAGINEEQLQYVNLASKLETYSFINSFVNGNNDLGIEQMSDIGAQNYIAFKNAILEEAESEGQDTKLIESVLASLFPDYQTIQGRMSKYIEENPGKALNAVINDYIKGKGLPNSYNSPLIEEFNELGISADEAAFYIEELTKAIIEERKEELKSKTDDAITFFNTNKSDFDENFIDGQNAFANAISNISAGSSVSYEDMWTLIGIDSTLVDKFSKSTDGYTISIKNLTEAQEKYKQETKDTFKTAIEDSQKRIIEYQNEIKNAKQRLEKAAGNRAIQKETDTIDFYNKLIDEENELIAKNQLMYEQACDSVSNYGQKLEDVVSKLSTFKSLYASIANDMYKIGRIGAESMVELINAFPEDWHKLVTKSDNGYVLDDEAYTQTVIRKFGFSGGDKDAIANDINNNIKNNLQSLANQYGITYDKGKSLAEQFNEISGKAAKAGINSGEFYNELNSLETEFENTNNVASIFADIIKTIIDSFKESKALTDFNNRVDKLQHKLNMGLITQAEYDDGFEAASTDFANAAKKEGLSGAETQEQIWSNEEAIHSAEQSRYQKKLDKKTQDLQDAYDQQLISAREYYDELAKLEDEYYGTETTKGLLDDPDGTNVENKNRQQLERRTTLVNDEIAQIKEDYSRGLITFEEFEQKLGESLDFWLGNIDELQETYKDLKRENISALYEAEVTLANNQLERGKMSNSQYAKEMLRIWEKYYKDKNGYRQEDLEAEQQAVEASRDAVQEQIDAFQHIIDKNEEDAEKQIDILEKQKEKIEDQYDKQIKDLEEQKDLIEEAADAEDRKLKILEAEEALEKAKNQRTVATVNANGTINYQANPDDVKKAEEDLKEAKKEEETAKLQERIDALEKEKETKTNTIDEEIKKIEEKRDKTNGYLQAVVDMLATLISETYEIDPELIKRLLNSKDAKAELEKINEEREAAGEEAITWADVGSAITSVEELIDSESTQEEKDDAIVDAIENTGTELKPIYKKQIGPDNTDKDTNKNADKDTNQDTTNNTNTNTNNEIDNKTDDKTDDKTEIPEKNDNTTTENTNALGTELNPMYVKLFNTPIPVTITDNVIESVSGEKAIYQTIDNQTNNNNNNFTFSGDIYINNPVTNSYDLAEDIVKNLPNAVAKQIHKKNQ